MRPLIDRVLHFVVPVGAVLTIIFSIGSIFYDGGLQLSSPPPPHVMKAYRKDVSTARP